jgi:ParB family chromosome partitioning protein
MTMPKPRLGKGLDALLGGDEGVAVATAKHTVAIGHIHTNPNQPRKQFDAEELKSLADSIRSHGILQPLVVRTTANGMQLIAGERRLKAAKEAGLEEVPVHIVDFNDQQVMEAALVENIQRTDLNPIEKAQGFADYLERFKMSEEQLGQRLGLGRTTISNLIGLLRLPEEVQKEVRNGTLSTGQAKVLKGLENPETIKDLAKLAISKGLTVAALEILVKEAKEAAKAGANAPAEAKPTDKPAAPDKTTHVASIEEELRQRLLVRGVSIKLKAKDKGQIVLSFDSNDDFERLIEVLRK